MRRLDRNAPQPVILRYVDYRDYLSDYYAWAKRVDRTFTYRSFGAQAGVSPSLLRDILSRRQNLSPTVMGKYADAMCLSARDRSYFEAMVHFADATDNAEKSRWFDRMAQLRGRSSITFLDAAQYQYFSQWYVPVVRELIEGLPADTHPKEIAEAITPRPTVPHVRQALRLMRELDLIYVDDQGVWRKRDRVLSSELQVQSMALRSYHLQMIERAREALDRYPSERREFQTLTLAGSMELFDRIKERIRAFTDELLAMASDEQEKLEAIFQVNLHQFPFVAKKPDGNGEGAGE